MTNKSPTYISCEDSMDISNADELYKNLRQSFDESNDIVINADRVDRVDTAAFQVFCAFFREADQRGLNVTWKNPSEPLIRSAKLLGIHDLLSLAG